MAKRTQGNVEARKRRAREMVKQKKQGGEYATAADYQTLDDKRKILERLGKPELIEIFKDWKPQIEKRRGLKKGPPLDQRVAISVTSLEKDDLNREIARIRKSGDAANVSEFIRGRSTGSVDIIGWKERAEELLKEIDGNSKDERRLKRRRGELRRKIEEMTDNPEYDEEDHFMAQKDLRKVLEKLETIETKSKKRAARLSGRMTTPEAETIKWRANRLNLSVSDYLRFCLFGHEPGSEGDAHLSVESKKRFYVGILDVADNGWGEPPTIHQCKQCQHYRDEAEKAKQRIRTLESFLPD